MFKGKFLHLLLVAALICSFLTPNMAAVSSCWYGAGNQYTKVTCSSTESGSCSKTEVNYQGVTLILKSCDSNSCGSLQTQGASTTSGGYTNKYWCCTSDNCNLSSALISNKLLTGFTILVATFAAFFKSI